MNDKKLQRQRECLSELFYDLEQIRDGLRHKIKREMDSQHEQSPEMIEFYGWILKEIQEFSTVLGSRYNEISDLLDSDEVES